MKKTALASFTILCLLSAVFLMGLSFNTDSAKADYAWTETIYIRADGSIDPPTAPISTVDTITYTLMDNIVGDVPGHSEVIAVQRDNIVIDGADHTVQGNGSYPSEGVDLTGRSNVTIKNMKVRKLYYGIHAHGESSNIAISGNTITNNGRGIELVYSSDNSVYGNNVTNNDSVGIYLFSSSDNNVSGNTITNNEGTAVFLSFSSNNTISGNNIAENANGVHLGTSSGNTISANNITDSSFNGIYLFDSDGNTISGNHISENEWDGIKGEYSPDSVIAGNRIEANKRYGIDLVDCANARICGNNIRANSEDGIRAYSNNYLISGNTIENNLQVGINLRWSTDGNVSGNDIGGNECGLWLLDSSENHIYHNNFLNNTQQVNSSNAMNVWDDGASRGNYWSDYEERYSDAKELDGSGVWDTPYVIDPNNQDAYPIIPEFPSFLILPLFMIATLVATILCRGKHSM